MQENSTLLDDSFVSKVQSVPVPVSRWLRLANVIIDGIIFDIFYGLIFYLAAFSGGISSLLFLYTGALVLYFIYYILLESKNGKTVGKMITRTRVVTLTGEQPDRGTIAIRTLCRIIPLEPLSFLFGRNGWHDTISKTVVIRG